mgnify:CR=1 FL=1|tara:strand:- start:7654 stop:8328 length:675 start_codon:yes stop_codon:yes gene_type:complete
MSIAIRNLFPAAGLLGLTLLSFDGAFAAEPLDYAQMPKSVEKYSEFSGQDLYHRGLYPEAMEVWRRAYEENNDTGALYTLATIYLDGNVVEKDIPEGLRLLKKSALHGEARAQFELGTIYDDCECVKRNAELAVLWYALASTQNDPGAEFSLAIHYEEGDGVEADEVLAFAYYHLAVSHGLPDNLLPVVEEFKIGLTESQKDAGRRKAEGIQATRVSSAVPGRW